MQNQQNQKYYFKHVLAIDCETTGIAFGHDDPSDGHQIVSIGIIVADTTTFKPIEQLYLEIQWNNLSIQSRNKTPSFGTEAEAIHGLTKAHLDATGVTEEEAAIQIANLIIKYWGSDNAISALGQNVATFDVPFLRALMRRHSIPLKFKNRHFDSFSLGIGTVGAYTSDALFTVMGNDQRDDHNALDDCTMSLEVFRVVKKLWTDIVCIEV